MQVEGLSAEEIAYRNAKAAAAASPEPRIDRTDSGRMEPDVSGWGSEEDADEADETDVACVGKLKISENKDGESKTCDVDVMSKAAASPEPRIDRTDSGRMEPDVIGGGSKVADETDVACVGKLNIGKEDDNIVDMKNLLEKSTKEKEALQAELEETKKRAAQLELNANDREDIAAKDLVDEEEATTGEATTGQELYDEQAGKSSNAKKRRWWLWLLLLAALVAIAGIIGVVIGRGGAKSNSTQANEGVGVVAENVYDTQAPVLSPASSIPEDEVFCPEETRPVKLQISLGARPSDVTYVVIDTCTGEAKYRCNRCYEDALPNVPVSFEGCLPTTSTFEGGKGPTIGRLRRAQAQRLAAYELRIINVSGGTSDFGYTLTYDGVPVSEVEEFANFDTIRFGEDGGAGGCTGSPTVSPATDAPSLSPLPDVPYIMPTLKPSTLDSTPPTLGPTQNYQNELDSCFAVEDKPSVCAEDDVHGLEQEIVFTEQQHFGSSVTFVGKSGNYLAAGSSDFPAHVHIYQRIGSDTGEPWSYLWTITEIVDDVDNKPSSFGGCSLDSNDAGYIFVGCSRTVYVFRPDSTFQSWSQSAKLVAPARSYSISAYGNKLAVSSPYENGKGAVYIYEERGSEWTEISVLSPQMLSDGALFGFSLSLYGDSPTLLAVGAPEDGIGGSAWVFRQSSANDWIPSLLTIRDVSPGDYLGAEIVIDSCTVAVTSLNDRTTFRTGIGSVRLFQWSGGVSSWVPTSILDIGAENALGEPEQYGECLALEGNTLLVGTVGLKSYSGVVHHYERQGGQWQKKGLISNESFLERDDGNPGCPIDLQKGRVVIGHSEDEVRPFSGAVSVFDVCPSNELV